MATCTAQLIFGRNDRDHGGISPLFKISLYENSRSLLILSKEPNNEEKGERIAYWLPTPINTLYDCMAMAAAYILKDEKVNMVINEARGRMNMQQDEMLELYYVENLADIYKAAKEAFANAKLKVVILMLENSSITEVVKDVLEYNVDVEVCKSVFIREYSEWTGKIEIRGEI